MARRPRPLCSLVRHSFLPSSFCLVFLCICLRLRLRNPNRIRIRAFLHFVICFVSIRPPRLAVFEDEAGSSEDTKNEEAGLALRSPPRRAQDVLFFHSCQPSWLAGCGENQRSDWRDHPASPGAPSTYTRVTRDTCRCLGVWGPTGEDDLSVRSPRRRAEARSEKREAYARASCGRVLSVVELPHPSAAIGH